MTFPTVTATGDAVPSDRQVKIDVSVEEQFTESSPARLQIRFGNHAATARRFLFGHVPPFSPLAAGDGVARIHVLPVGGRYDGLYYDAIPDRPVDGCWTLRDTYDVLESGTIWSAEPGEVISMEYVVLDDSRSTECLSPGTYRFEDSWGEQHESRADSHYVWGFTLDLEA